MSEPIAKPHSPAATATAGPLLEPPGMRWVAASHGFQGVPCGVLMPSRAERELDRLDLAEDHAAGAPQRLDERPFGPDQVGDVEPRAGGRRHAVDREDVLDRDRHAHQRPEVGAGREQPVERAGAAASAGSDATCW